MTDIADRTEKLRARIKRKREEVEGYLNERFYNTCREILRRAEARDEKGVFRRDPATLDGYSSHVSHPMCWNTIRKSLAAFKYASPQGFIEDMRLVVNNCYAYNTHESAFSAMARSIETAMEDAFVKELGEAPPSVAEMKMLSKKLPPQASGKVLQIFNLYEPKDSKATDSKTYITLTACRCATKRRILEFMRVAVAQKEARAAREGMARKVSVMRSVPVKRPPVPVVRSMAGTGPDGDSFPRADAPPSTAILQAAGDDLDFHEEAGPATLERVPQNTRAEGFALGDISPAQLDDGLSDDDASTGDASQPVSEFLPVEGVRDEEEDSPSTSEPPVPDVPPASPQAAEKSTAANEEA